MPGSAATTVSHSEGTGTSTPSLLFSFSGVLCLYTLTTPEPDSVSPFELASFDSDALRCLRALHVSAAYILTG